MTGQSAGPGAGCQWDTSTSTLDPEIGPCCLVNGSGPLISELGDMRPDGGSTLDGWGLILKNK